jgi:AAA+ ATPase superfamily predicted ATPase
VLVVGNRKSGKTTLIKGVFEYCKIIPDTNFLLDSVRNWEGLINVEGEEGQISFVEMDSDAGIVDKIGKLESMLTGASNFLCLVLKISDNSTLKNQTHIRLFFEKFTRLVSYFKGCVVINNDFVSGSKNNIFNVKNGENNFNFYESLCLGNMFKGIFIFILYIYNIFRGQKFRNGKK